MDLGPQRGALWWNTAWLSLSFIILRFSASLSTPCCMPHYPHFKRLWNRVLQQPPSPSGEVCCSWAVSNELERGRGAWQPRLTQVLDIAGALGHAGVVLRQILGQVRQLSAAGIPCCKSDSDNTYPVSARAGSGGLACSERQSGLSVNQLPIGPSDRLRERKSSGSCYVMARAPGL